METCRRQAFKTQSLLQQEPVNLLGEGSNTVHSFSWQAMAAAKVTSE